MTTPMVPVTISGVLKRTGSGSAIPSKYPYFIMLTETGGDRRMWICVGHTEATALAISLSGNELPRPLTYQFTAALLAAAGARLREIRISHLTDGIFYAQAVLSTGAVIDTRPSDALNLAAISDVPVYAAAELLDHYTRNSSPIPRISGPRSRPPAMTPRPSRSKNDHAPELRHNHPGASVADMYAT